MTLLFVPVCQLSNKRSVLKGVVYYTPDPQPPPFQPPTIPPFGKQRDRMMYLYITDYVVNAGFYAAFRTGNMSFNVTEDNRNMVSSKF